MNCWHVPLADASDVDQAVAAARAALAGKWGQINGEQRAQQLWRIADLLDANVDHLAEIETLDNGKPFRVSRYDVILLRDISAIMQAGQASWKAAPFLFRFPTSSSTRREPMGVVGLIIPWNFPLLMAAWKLAPALAAGNTTILKPAEQTPLSALRLVYCYKKPGCRTG